ncbi:metal ABC transporter solute-binding protein, Zn/Mn family [Aquibacillus kalidii]|uniref:metal ABC transporter solute-binding protein, Zn/Mn family n=1 Tax=Aquibacillus kalidii TaxID=2762597 RepID=UPI0016492D30|nr:zinc ABC transporter substrate-binding protein [Aquibacillus kalidii]
MRQIYLVLILLLLSLSVGCNNQSGNNSDDEPVIYTSIYPIQYIVERLTGTSVQVETVYPPGTDPHSYEPTAKEMTRQSQADAFFYLGSNLETFTETVAGALEQEDVHLIELGVHEQLFELHQTNGLELDTHGLHDEHHHGDHDPHIWLDPIRTIKLASFIKEELKELIPVQSQKIDNNYKLLVADLKMLDEKFKQVLAEKEHKELLVSHASLGYWEDRYGIEQIAVNGVSSNSEPSQKDLIHIIETAKNMNLHYMIFEQNVSNSVSKKLQDEIGASTLIIHNLSVLTDEDIKNEQDYLSLMKQNIKVLDQATN